MERKAHSLVIHKSHSPFSARACVHMGMRKKPISRHIKLKDIKRWLVIKMTKRLDDLKSVYDKLLAKTKDLFVLQSARSIVYWDMETKMPPKGIKLRSQQLALLNRIEHKMRTDPEFGVLLERIEKHSDYETLSKFQRRNTHLIRKEYDEQTKLPEKLVEETAKQEAITIDIWKKAKTAKKFSMFKPELKKLYDLRKQAADILMEVKNTATPYDALIDIFEPKMTSDLVNKIFGELKTNLIPIIHACETAPKQPDLSILKRKIPIATQREISKSLAEFVGYDVESENAGGRIDETEHPFTGGYFDDVRITTHYYEDRIASSLFSILHEAGHAIYDQNLNHEWMYQPIGMGCSHGFHESQSRFVENMVGRSHEFWTHYLPKLKALVAGTFADVNLGAFIHSINHVRPSKIRVEADEVTYCLHIIIRFEIEQDLIPGEIAVEDLPEIWNQKYKKYLGVDIENDSEGVLQDIHWAGGDFGYFPTYALGNIISGQLLQTMGKSVSDWKEQIAEGNFRNIKKWLVENVHQQGNLYDPTVLIKKITGEEMNAKPYYEYLDSKCSWVYEC